MKCNETGAVPAETRADGPVKNSGPRAPGGAGGDRDGPRYGHFFVMTKTPFQSSGGGLSTNSIERWMYRFETMSSLRMESA